MNRTDFYAALKNTSLFGKSLTTPQVVGMTALLDAAIEYGVKDPHHVANMFAQTWHETGGYMFPIKETVMPTASLKDPSDATVIARLNNAWKKGQLPWVKEDYWTAGWFGRGMVQITHEGNYIKLGKAIGVDIAAKPSLALDPKVSAQIVVVGMMQGLFTGKKLSDFTFPAALSAPVKLNPRRIINGQDGTDAEVAKAHRVFYNALMAGKYSLT